MTKGTQDGKPKLDTTKQSARIKDATPRNGDTTDAPVISVRTAGVLSERNPEGRPEDQPANSLNDAGSKSKPRAKKIIPTVRGIDEAPTGSSPSSKRLTDASVARLRGEDELQTPVGQLRDEYAAKQATASQNFNRGFNLGREKGYAAGVNYQRQVQAKIDKELSEDNPGNIKLWQCFSALLTGILIGMLFALFTKGL